MSHSAEQNKWARYEPRFRHTGEIKLSVITPKGYRYTICKPAAAEGSSRMIARHIPRKSYQTLCE